MRTEGLEKLHRITFSTPKILTSLTILGLFLLLAYRFKIGILNFVVFSSILAVSIPILKVKFDLRRYTFFLAFVSLAVILIDIISKPLNTNPIAGIFVAFVSTTVLYFTSESNLIKTGIASLLMSMSISPTPLTVLGTLMGFLFVEAMDRDFDGFNVRKYFKSFLLSWLTDNPHYFEEVLKERATDFKGWIKFLKFGDIKLVTTSFHPGPIRNIGGARLVNAINSMENAFYLHSPTYHALNPVSYEEVEKIIRSIDFNGEKVIPMKPYEIESERYVLRVFPFDKVKLMFIIGKECIDDLPYELNVDNAIVVDSHNAHCKNFRPNVEELRRLIKEGLKRKTEFCKLRYAFKKFEVETNSICGSVSILLLDYGFERHAIIVFDGNNVDLEFRKEIEKFCKMHGFKATVASTDNHSKTGVSTKFTYLPVGSDNNDRVIFELLKDVFTLDFKECEIEFGKRDVVVKVVGEDFCRFVSSVSSFGVKISNLYFVLLITAFGLSLIL